MTRRTLAWTAGAGLLVAAAIAWTVIRVTGAPEASGEPSAARPPAADASSVAHIRATVFHGAAEGDHLVPVTREVRLAAAVDLQAREILAAALEPPKPPLLPVIPSGTALRGFFVSEGGDAFVDLSTDVVTNHPGGSTAELLTTYAIVNAVTGNLPTIKRVQILVDGKEVETLAGHVDLRRPLEPSRVMVKEERQ